MQGVLFLGIIILVFYVIVRLASTAAARLAGARFRAYRQLAQRYQGKYESRGLSEPPTISFAHNGSHVRVGLAPTVPGQTLPPRTRVVARFARGLPFRLELAPVSRPAPTQAPKGTRVVRVGEETFDRGFVTQANDADITREFLSPGVRWSLENLRKLCPPSGMLISINPERLLVQVDRNLGLSTDALDFAVYEALQVHDQLLTSVRARLAEGIAIVGVGPSSEAEDGPPVCKVCGESITDARVLCTSCRTPHHRDCWQFVGGCSIFGCQGKQCISA